jgi:hypothetical protein
MVDTGIFNMEEINPLIKYKITCDINDDIILIELSKYLEIVDNFFLTIENIKQSLLLYNFMKLNTYYLKSFLSFISLLNLEYKNNHDFLLIVFELYNNYNILNSLQIDIPNTIDLFFYKSNISKFLNLLASKNRYFYLIHKLSNAIMVIDEITYLFILTSIYFCKYYTFEEFVECIDLKLHVKPENKILIINNVEPLKKIYIEHSENMLSIHDFSKIKKIKITNSFNTKIKEIIKCIHQVNNF